MLRRDLLRAAASAAAAATALSILPSEAQAAWARVASLTPQQTKILSASQIALMREIADMIIPRTATPGAIDVGVMDFLNVIIAEYFTDAERSAFITGLDAIDAMAKTTGGAAFPALSVADRTTVMNALDRPTDRTLPAVRTYSRLKGLVVSGYFTSERVQKEVLKTNIMPGKFEGDAPMKPKSAGDDASDHDAHQFASLHFDAGEGESGLHTGLIHDGGVHQAGAHHG